MSLEKLQSPPKGTCYEVHRLMCLSANEMDEAAFQEFGAEVDSGRSLEEAQRDTQMVLDAYKDRRDNDAIGEMAVGASFEFVKGVLYVGAKVAAPATLGASLALEGVNYGLGKVMDASLEAYKESAAEASGRVLMNHLKALREKGEDLDRFRTMDPSLAVEEILSTSSSGSVPTIDLSKVDPNGRPFLNHHSIEQLKSFLTEQEKLNDFVDAQQAVAIDELQKDAQDMGVMANSLLQIQKDGTEHLKALRGTMEEVQADVKELEGMVGENAEGIAFLKEFMFGSMSPEDQLKALESGKFKLPDQKSKEKALKVLVGRRKLVSDANKYLNGASVVAGVLGQAGILKPKLVADVNKAANTGLAVVNGLSALASGNYIGAISAVGSLMGIWGKKGPDVATQRHEQIMEQFGILQQGQEQIMENQEKLMEGQREIMRLQVETYRAVQSMGKRIEKRFDEVMESLGRIHHDVLVNRRLIEKLLTDDLDAGHKFLADMRKWRDDYDLERQRFNNFGAMQTYFSDAANYPNFNRGMKAIEDARPDDATLMVDDRLRLDTYEESSTPGEQTGVSAYLDAYSSTLGLASLRKGESAEFVSSLLLPVVDVTHLDAKEADLDSSKANQDLLAFVERHIAIPLSVDALSKVYGLLLGFQVYYQLRTASEPTQLDDFSDFETKKYLSKSALIRLEEALMTVDTAVAQQSLFAGEALLPAVKEAIEAVLLDPKLAKEPAYQSVIEAVKANGLLRRNLAMYLAHHAVYGEGQNQIFTYQVASGMSATYPDYLKHIFGPGYEFKHEPDENYPNPWLLVLPGGLSLRLPSAEKLQHGHLEHPAEMQDLLALRERLLDSIMAYEWPADLSESERAMVFDLNILSNAQLGLNN